MAIDKQRIARCFSRALASYADQATAQQQINQRLIAMLRQTGRTHFSNGVEIGCGTGDLSEKLLAYSPNTAWLFNDLSEQAVNQHRQRFAACPHRYLATDAEQLTLAECGRCDLLASASAVQWFNQPQRLVQLASQLLPAQGLFLFSTFLPDNLKEIKQLTHIGLDYPTESQWRAWLAPDFEVIGWDNRPIRLTFPHPKAVLTHLKATGVTATQTRGWTKGQFVQFDHNYRQQFSDAHGVSLTYAPLLVLAQRQGK